MAYGDFKDLPGRMTSDKYLIKHLVLLKIQNMMDINVDFQLASTDFKFFDTKSVTHAETQINSNSDS